MKKLIGKKATLTTTFSIEDVIKFAALSGDKNPIHLNSEYAKNTIFEKPIVHGFFYGSMISNILAMQLPGEGTIYLEQNMKFLAPVFHGDTLIAEVEIVDVIPEKSYVLLKTTINKDNGTLVLSGEAKVKNSKFVKNHV